MYRLSDYFYLNSCQFCSSQQAMCISDTVTECQSTWKCLSIDHTVECARLIALGSCVLFVVVLISKLTHANYVSWPKLPRLLEFTGVKRSVEQLTRVSGSSGFAPLFCSWSQSDGLENPAQREPLSRSSRKVTLVSAMPRSKATAPGSSSPLACTACTSTVRHMYVAQGGVAAGPRLLFNKSCVSCEEKRASVRRRAND